MAESPKKMNYSLNLRICGSQKFFGPGLARLLILVEETNSLRTAASQMAMAYSKAWKMVKNAEANLGFDLLDCKTGGKGGGGAVLTHEGRQFLEKYDGFAREVYLCTDSLWQKYFGSLQKLTPAEGVGAVVMASGYSRRMGCNKLLLELEGKPVIQHLLRQIGRLDFQCCLVVSQYPQILDAGQAAGFLTRQNDQAAEGKSASIRLALQALPNMQGYCFFTGDQILLKDRLLADLLKIFRQDSSRIVVPTYQGQWGSPALFPGDLRRELLQLQGEQGGKLVMERHKERVVTLAAEPAWQGWDFDTPAQWIQAQQRWQQRN